MFPQELFAYDPGTPGHEKVLFPEYLTCEDKSLQLARHVIEWLTDEPKRQALMGRLKALKQQVAHGGASGTAADLILHDMAARQPPIPRPHFVPMAEVVRTSALT